jgi:hypothetical protein
MSPFAYPLSRASIRLGYFGFVLLTHSTMKFGMIGLSSIVLARVKVKSGSLHAFAQPCVANDYSYIHHPWRLLDNKTLPPQHYQLSRPLPPPPPSFSEYCQVICHGTGGWIVIESICTRMYVGKRFAMPPCAMRCCRCRRSSSAISSMRSVPCLYGETMS